MKRREFLKMGSFMTVSVAALGVTACGSSNEPDSDNVGGSGPIQPNPVRPDAPTAPAGSTWKFPQSIATGDPRPNSIVFWTRVVRDELTATQEATVDVALRLYITKDDNSANLGTTTALTGVRLQDTTTGDAWIVASAYVDFDGTVRKKVALPDPDTVYFYQFAVVDASGNETRSKVGRTKTAPTETSTNDVKFAFMSCQDWSDNHWGAFTQIVADDGSTATPSLDFIVHLGDYIYETSTTSPTGEAAHGALTLPSGGIALTAGSSAANGRNDYRYLYKMYRGDTRIQAMHERFPVVAIWDDHEFSDDCWQSSETYDNNNTLQPDRRRNANQAWFEYTPADVVFMERDSGFQNIKIYRDLKFGQTVHLVMTDERLYRADHMIPETAAKPGTSGVGAANQLGRINSRYLAPEATYKQFEVFKYGANANDPLANITMLGKTQREWWKTTMKDSTATWKIWGNEVSLLRMGLHGVNALAGLISLGIFSKLASADGIPNAKTQLEAGTKAQLEGAPANAPIGVSAAVTAQMSSAGLPTLLPTLGGSAANAQPLAAQVATAIAMSAAGGGDATAKFMAAKGALTNPANAAGTAITDPYATQLAQAAVGAFDKANAVGSVPIAAAVAGAVANGATQAAAGPAAFAIVAKSADPTATDSDIVTTVVTAGLLSATQAQAAVGGYLNAFGVGNVTIASAIAGAAAAGTDTTVAAQAALVITVQDADPTATTTHRVEAATAAGLGLVAAKAAVAAYETAKAKIPDGVSAQIESAAKVVAFQQAEPNIKTDKKDSPFYITATGASAAAASAFFQKFLLNADQWDGYAKERKELMTHLLTANGGIQNVVAITGDIHSFWAGQVYDEYPGQITGISATGSAVETTGGQVAMVDLVTAGISSTSWFNYIKEAADQLDPTNALIGKLVYAPVPVAVPANALFTGSPAMSFTLNLNLLDYSMGKIKPTDVPTALTATSLAAQLTDQLKRKLAANGIPEYALDSAATGIQGIIAGSATFQAALGLAQKLATSVAANPWLAHVDTEAQGYSVVTASTGQLKCEFKKVNPLVGAVAPTSTPPAAPSYPGTSIIASTKTATITAGSTTITMS